MPDAAIISAARVEKIPPAVLYESKAAYQAAMAGLRGKEVETAVLRRLGSVRAGGTGAAPRFLFGVAHDDLRDAIGAAGSGNQATVDRVLGAAVALSGGAERFKELSPGECAMKARDSVARLRAELKDGPSSAGYAHEAERLAALLSVLRPHKGDGLSVSDIEHAYFVPDERPPGGRDEMFADHPWYAWRGGTVRILRAGEAARPAWRGRKLRLMYLDGKSFLSDITSLTDAQMNQRLSAWLDGPPADAIAAWVSRVAFDHAVEMRQCSVAQTVDPSVPAQWAETTKLSLDNLQLVLRAKRGPTLRSALDRLRTDAELLSVLAHIGSTHSDVDRWVDEFHTAVERLVE